MDKEYSELNRNNGIKTSLPLENRLPVVVVGGGDDDVDGLAL